MSEILSAGKIELLWKRDHKRKLADDVFRFVEECLHMQSLEQSISEDSDMFNAGYEAGRKTGRQSVIEWIKKRLINTGHLISVGTEEDTTVFLASRSPLTLPEWQELLEETRGNELGI